MKKAMIVGLLLAAVATGVLSAGPRLPRRRVEADPTKDYRLKENCGPWMIMVTTFNPHVSALVSREEALKDTFEVSRQLVLEVRKTFNIPAYIYPMRSNFGEDLPEIRRRRPRRTSYRLDPEELGEGLALADVSEQQLAKLLIREESYVEPVGTRVREFDQVAVLAGDYATMDQARHMLEKIKRWNPQTIQALVRGRQFLLPRDAPGPLWQAFVTPNPYVPSDYLQTQEPDRLLLQMNQGRYSLYDCPGRYTVLVAKFAGRTAIDYHRDKLDKFVRELETTDQDRLQRAAVDAIELTKALRAHGWEAYVFHTRNSSTVSVGSFDLNPEQLVRDPLFKHTVKSFAGEPVGDPPQPRPKRYGRWQFNYQPLPMTVPRRDAS